MGIQVDDKKLSWVIENFKFLQYEKIYSDQFIIAGCKWHLTAHPNADNLFIFLEVAERESLPYEWKRHAQVFFTVVNQLNESLSHLLELQKLFDEKTPSWGFAVPLPQSLLHDTDNGFLVNNEVKILAEIHVLEAIGGILDESNVSIQPLKKIKKENDDELLNKTQQFEETVEVYGFIFLSSQVQSVKRIFESHPDMASGVRTTSPFLRTTYINVLLGVIETLCQSPQQLTDDDLKEACMAASCLAYAGFKVDWLEKMLHEMLEKKYIVKSGEARLKEMEQELVKLNKECSDLKILLEKEKAEVATAKIPLSLVG